MQEAIKKPELPDNEENVSNYDLTIRKRSAIEMHGQFFRDTIFQYSDVVWALYNLDGRLTALDLFKNMEEPEMISPEPPPQTEADTVDSSNDYLKQAAHDPSIISVLPDDPAEYAFQIFSGTASSLNRKKVAEIVGRSDPYHGAVREAYMRCFDFQGQTLVDSFRYFCSVLYLTGETQVVDRILLSFAKRFYECNADTSVVRTLYLHHEVLYVLIFSMVLLNTDLHIASVGQKMRAKDFTRNTIKTVEATAVQVLAHGDEFLDPNANNSIDNKANTDVTDESTVVKREPSGTSVKAATSAIADISLESNHINTVTSFSSVISQMDAQTWKKRLPVQAPKTSAEWKKWRYDMESHLKEIYYAIKNNRILQKSLSLDAVNMAKMANFLLKDDQGRLLTDKSLSKSALSVSSSSAASLGMPTTPSALQVSALPDEANPVQPLLNSSPPTPIDTFLILEKRGSAGTDSATSSCLTPTVNRGGSAEFAPALSSTDSTPPTTVLPVLRKPQQRRNTLGSLSQKSSFVELESSVPFMEDRKGSLRSKYQASFRFFRSKTSAGSRPQSPTLPISGASTASVLYNPERLNSSLCSNTSVMSNVLNFANNSLPQPPTTAGRPVYQGLVIRKQLLDKNGSRARFRRWRKSWLVLCADGERGVELWTWRCFERQLSKSHLSLFNTSPQSHTPRANALRPGEISSLNASASLRAQSFGKAASTACDSEPELKANTEKGEPGIVNMVRREEYSNSAENVTHQRQTLSSDSTPRESTTALSPLPMGSGVTQSLREYISSAVTAGSRVVVPSSDDTQFGSAVQVVGHNGKVVHVADLIKFRSSAPETIPLCHAVAIPLPPPGYDEKRPSVFSVVLPNNVVYLFQVPSIENAHSWCSKINIWAARKSKEPLMASYGNAEYGWTWLKNKWRSSSDSITDAAQPSSESLTSEELNIVDWEPLGGLGKIASKLNDEEQLAAWQRVLQYLDGAIHEHASFQKPMVERFGSYSNLIQKVMQNWLKRYQYLIKEYKRYLIYAEALRSVSLKRSNNLASTVLLVDPKQNETSE